MNDTRGLTAPLTAKEWRCQSRSGQALVAHRDLLGLSWAKLGRAWEIDATLLRRYASGEVTPGIGAIKTMWRASGEAIPWDGWDEGAAS